LQINKKNELEIISSSSIKKWSIQSVQYLRLLLRLYKLLLNYIAYEDEVYALYKEGIDYLKRIRAVKPPMIVISGSCVNFEKERQKIIEFIGELEWGIHSKSNCECSSNGSALGWDFFQIYFDPEFVERLLDVHPDIGKEEGNMIEQQFVLWISKKLKKRKQEYHLKLSDVPYEDTQGFRLNPENYRDDSELEKLR